MASGLHPGLSMFDVIVIGGGPAGLSAALMLGRCRRRTLLCDNGQPRNRRSMALHGYFTRDGVAPTEFTALGLGELARYGIDVRPIVVTGAAWSTDHFQVSLGDGAQEIGRFLLLATGVNDQLPPFDGTAQCYGRSMFHCPYCHGWEWRDRRLAVFGIGMAAVGLALSLKTWTADVVLCTNGARLPARPRARLAGNVRTALLMAVVALAITSLEGLLLTPWLTSRASRMNAVAIFVGLLFWGWVWSVWGMLLAVPMLMVVKSVCDHIEDFKSVGELLGE